MLGVETPGLYEASPPRRRSDSFKATEALAIAEAAAAAAKAASADSGVIMDTGGGVGVTLREVAAATHETGALGEVEDGAGVGGGKERDNLLQIGGAAR